MVCEFRLINPNLLSTAAHCVLKIPETWVLSKVRLGEWDLNEEPDCFNGTKTACAPKVQDIAVAENIVHTNYDRRSSDTRNDIALLRLKKRVIENKYVKPICLPLERSLMGFDYTGKNFVVSGWGESAFNFFRFVHKTSLLQGKPKLETKVPSR